MDNKHLITSPRYFSVPLQYTFSYDTDYDESPTYLEAYLNSFSSSDEPLWIRQPGIKYQPTRVFRHKDSLGRLWIGPEDDRYLSATDGRLSELVVQASEDVWNGPSNSTWARKKVQKCTPAMLRVVYSLLGDHLQSRPGASWGDVCLGWLPACLIIAVLVCGSILIIGFV